MMEKNFNYLYVLFF